MQQDRGHPAGLSVHCVAVLAGTLVIIASHVATASGAASPRILAPSGAHHPAYGGDAGADLTLDDEALRVTRVLKQRTDSAGGVPAPRGLADAFSWTAPAAVALVPPAGRPNLSLGPRAPPRAFNFDFRRLAWLE
jgi:hypothetical protein